MENVDKVLFSFNWDGDPPTEEDIFKKFNFPIGSIDEIFGIIEIDPFESIYCILISPEFLNKCEDGEGFSNPRIEPFGLEEE